MTDVDAAPAGAAATDGDPPPAEPPSAHARPTRLLLVRHAVTRETGPKLTGRAPGVDLSDEGVAQAEAVGRRLAGLPVAAVYASPIERTMQTAACIAAHHDLPVQPLPGLIEAEYGEWTGRQLADLAKTPAWKVVQVAPSRARFPGGETIREMQARIVSALEVLGEAHPDSTVVVVSHADPIKAAVAHFCGLHLDLFQRIQIAPASVTALDLHTLGCMLLKLNDTGSLDDLLPAAAPAAVPGVDDAPGPSGAAAGEASR